MSGLAVEALYRLHLSGLEAIGSFKPSVLRVSRYSFVAFVVEDACVEVPGHAGLADPVVDRQFFLERLVQVERLNVFEECRHIATLCRCLN